MKTNIFIPFILIAAITFYGCSKKQAASEIEMTSPVPAETVSERTKIPEPSNEDSFSEEDKVIIRYMERRNGPIIRYSYDDLIESRPSGTYILYYSVSDSVFEQVRPPVTAITYIDLSMNGKEAYARFSSCLNAKGPGHLRGCNRNGGTLIAIEEEDKDDNILTLLFSNDHAKTWKTAHIEIPGEYLGEQKLPRYFPFCTDSNTGYLLIGGYEYFMVDGSRDSETIPSAHIFRTQDAGVSWTEIGRISVPVQFYIFVRENTVFLSRHIEKNRYPCIFKSDDYTNWEEIYFPIDTEKYRSGYVEGFLFEGDYGIVVTIMYPFDRDSNFERIVFATKDGGKTWIEWNGE